MEQADRIEHIGDPAVADALYISSSEVEVHYNDTLQIHNQIYEMNYSLDGSKVEIRYDPDWIEQHHVKLTLYVDSVHVGDASFVQLYDNALKRRPSGRSTDE